MPHSPGLSFTLFSMIRMSWLGSGLVAHQDSIIIFRDRISRNRRIPNADKVQSSAAVPSLVRFECRLTRDKRPGLPVNTAVALVLLTILLSRIVTSDALTDQNAFPLRILNREARDVDVTEPGIVESIYEDAVGQTGGVDD